MTSVDFFYTTAGLSTLRVIFFDWDTDQLVHGTTGALLADTDANRLLAAIAASDSTGDNWYVAEFPTAAVAGNHYAYAYVGPTVTTTTEPIAEWATEDTALYWSGTALSLGLVTEAPAATGLLGSVMLADNAAFLNTDAFGEQVVYRKLRAGATTARTIAAVVNRDIMPDQDEENAGTKEVMLVNVANNSTTGISVTEMEANDTITVAYRIGETAQACIIGLPVSIDVGQLMFRLRTGK